MSGMELEVKYGELVSLGAKSNLCVCAIKEESAATCTGVCVCVDDKYASFTKEDGKKDTCVNITLLGF